jgi:cytochrome c-type biogenesis protein CcmH/NrfG
MLNESITEATVKPTLQAAQVYAMAVVCLVLGLAVGYLFRASEIEASPAQTAVNSSSTTPGGATGGSAPSTSGAMIQTPAGNLAQSAAGASPQSPHGSAMGSRPPSLDEMKQMADAKAAPLLARLKKDPNNTALLDQVGAIYHSTHQFNQAAAYYEKAVRVDSKNVAMRTKLAISLYRSDDVDGAIAQLDQALSYDPKDVNALFDLGMIRLQGKQDSKGALAAWQQLLKSNPQLSPDRKATVQKLMASVQSAAGDQRVFEGGRSK